MARHIQHFLTILTATLVMFSCSPPPPSYPDSPLVQARRTNLTEDLLRLLPHEQASLPQAIAEARWLSDTAYKAAAGISRINDSSYPGWAGNSLINLNLQDRGLCWQYQQDMYRELRRRPLKFFRLGFCVRDERKLREHNCVYIAAKNGAWPQVWMLDAWIWNGRLEVKPGWRLNQKQWKESILNLADLAATYKEGHEFPIEHWFSIKTHSGLYEYFRYNSSRRSPQYHRMYKNILKGREEHPNSLINY